MQLSGARLRKPVDPREAHARTGVIEVRKNGGLSREDTRVIPFSDAQRRPVVCWSASNRGSGRFSYDPMSRAAAPLIAITCQ